MDRAAIERVVREMIARMEAESTRVPPAPEGSVAGDRLGDRRLPGALGPGMPEDGTIPVEMSARHVHLCREDLMALFGTDSLVSQRAISQPGQFLSTLRVRLIGPKGVLDNVAVLGPVRGATQAEISATDARHLGVCAPVNLSGDLSGAATVFLQAGDALLKRACAIIARRHVHMTPDEADAFGVMDGEEVSLAVAGSRPVILTGVVARVSPQSALALHMDTDEANAAGAWESTVCRMVRVPRDAFARSTSAGGAPSGSMVRDGAPIVNLSIGSTSGQTGAATVGTPAGPGRTAPGTVSPATEHTAAAPRGEITLEGKLICESAVLALPKGGVTALRLMKGQLITPLASDALRARGITLRREGRA